jgi:hypothetical protein
VSCRECGRRARLVTRCRGRASCSAPTICPIRAYRVGAGVTAAEGAGAGEPPTTTGRLAHAEKPVSNVMNASPRATDFITVLLLSGMPGCSTRSLCLFAQRALLRA